MMNNWLGRVIIFLIAGGACILSLHYTTSHFKPERQLILLNRTRPDFHDFINIEKQAPKVFSRNDLKEYFDYFHLVTEAMPQNSDGILMLGYLDLITGHETQAAVLFKQANQIDPGFFFTEYDLALVNFRDGDYSQSIGLLQRALAITPQSTVNRMMTSVIYRQILASMNNSDDIITGLQQDYHDAYVLLIEASAKQKEIQGENVGPQVSAHIL